MGHRLSKIVTRTGDAGTTGLGDGARVAKDAARIDAIGAVDELNSSIGVLLAETLPDAVSACLVDVQHDLFDLGGELSIPGYEAVSEAHVTRLEERVEHFNAPLAPLKEFVLPGGTRAAALAHVARTVCRRAERALVRLGHDETVSVPARRYLNRLSDLLFVIARALNVAAGRPDVLWKKGESAAPERSDAGPRRAPPWPWGARGAASRGCGSEARRLSRSDRDTTPRADRPLPNIRDGAPLRRRKGRQPGGCRPRALLRGREERLPGGAARRKPVSRGECRPPLSRYGSRARR